jgi:hypothetical protein
MRAVEDYRRRTQHWENVQLKLDDNSEKTGLQIGEGLEKTTSRKSAIQWDSPFYQAHLRRTRISKAFNKDEEEGRRDVGLESPRPKTGWV